MGRNLQAVDKAEEFLKERPLSSYYDDVALPGLRLAQNDVLRGAAHSDDDDHPFRRMGTTCSDR